MKELIITHKLCDRLTTGNNSCQNKMINVYFVNTLDQSITQGSIKVLEHLFDNPKLE